MQYFFSFRRAVARNAPPLFLSSSSSHSVNSPLYSVNSVKTLPLPILSILFLFLSFPLPSPAADFASTERWYVDTERLTPHNIDLRRGEQRFIEPIFRSYNTAIDISPATNGTVIMRYASSDLTNFYSVTGSVLVATSGTVRIPWTTANETITNRLTYDIIVSSPTSSIVRCYGNLTLATPVGYNGTVTNNPPVWISSSGSGDMLKSENLSGLANTATARTNLGLGTAATNAEGAFATAAQGALADTALQSVTNHTQAWSTITDTPISLAGYGITNTVLYPADTNNLQSQISYLYTSNSTQHSAIGDLQLALPVHTNRTDNPHLVTAAQVGALTNNQTGLTLGGTFTGTISKQASATNSDYAAVANVASNLTDALTNYFRNGANITNLTVGANQSPLTNNLNGAGYIISNANFVGNGSGLTNLTDVATAAQGALASTAVQTNQFNNFLVRPHVNGTNVLLQGEASSGGTGWTNTFGAITYTNLGLNIQSGSNTITRSAAGINYTDVAAAMSNMVSFGMSNVLVSSTVFNGEDTITIYSPRTGKTTAMMSGCDSNCLNTTWLNPEVVVLATNDFNNPFDGSTNSVNISSLVPAGITRIGVYGVFTGNSLGDTWTLYSPAQTNSYGYVRWKTLVAGQDDEKKYDLYIGTNRILTGFFTGTGTNIVLRIQDGVD
jgi:hypothetical protein